MIPYTCGGLSTAFRNGFFSTMWVWGNKLKLSDCQQLLLLAEPPHWPPTQS